MQSLKKFFKKFKKPITAISILALLSPFLLYTGLYVYFKIEERNEAVRVQKIIDNLNYIPPVPDEELKSKIFFETDKLTQEEQVQITEYLLQNKRKVIINAERVEFSSKLENSEKTMTTTCHKRYLTDGQLLSFHVKAPDINKSGTIYLAKMPEDKDWQECTTQLGLL